MAGILSNGSYILKPPGDYDYVMYDAGGNFVEGIKRADGNYSFGFHRYYTSAPSSATWQIVQKYVSVKEINPAATAAVYMFSGCRFLETVEGQFDNVKASNYMFASCSSLKSVPDNFLNGVVESISANSTFSQVSSLSSWGNNTFNSITGVANIIPVTVTGMISIDGWATSFEMVRGLNLFTAASYSGYNTVTSNLIPIIDHFKNKTVPMKTNTAHMFKQFTAAADYNECTASPIYSGWVL